jgi:hypothetical protein
MVLAQLQSKQYLSEVLPVQSVAVAYLHQQNRQFGKVRLPLNVFFSSFSLGSSRLLSVLLEPHFIFL